MTDKRDKIIDRVRALLAQAEDPGTADEEAQAFNAKAAEIMARYDLDEATVRQERGEAPEPVERWDYVIPGTGGHGKARVAALAAIARAYGCESAATGNDATPHPRKLIVIGTTSALESLKILLPPIVAMMEANAAKAARAYVDNYFDPYWYGKNDRAAARRDFYRSYLRGWGAAVAEKINTARGVIAEEAEGSGAALVLVTNADRVRSEFTRRFPKLGKVRAERFDRRGYQAGVKAGHQTDLGTTKINNPGRKAIE